MPRQVRRPAGAIRHEEYQQLAAFRYAIRQFLRFSEEAAGRVGLTPQQYQALLAVRGSRTPEQVTVGELAEQLQIRHHSAVGLVNRLASQALLRRERATDDRRRVLLHLTSRGEQLLARLAAVHREEIRRLRPQMQAVLRSARVSRSRA